MRLCGVRERLSGRRQTPERRGRRRNGPARRRPESHLGLVAHQRPPDRSRRSGGGPSQRRRGRGEPPVLMVGTDVVDVVSCAASRYNAAARSRPSSPSTRGAWVHAHRSTAVSASSSHTALIVNDRDRNPSLAGVLPEQMRLTVDLHRRGSRRRAGAVGEPGGQPVASARSVSSRDPAREATPRPPAVTTISGRSVVPCTHGVPVPLGDLVPSASPESQAGQALPCFYTACRPTRSDGWCNARVKRSIPVTSPDVDGVFKVDARARYKDATRFSFSVCHGHFTQHVRK